VKFSHNKEAPGGPPAKAISGKSSIAPNQNRRLYVRLNLNFGVGKFNLGRLFIQTQISNKVEVSKVESRRLQIH
jgi:hypothetical protein